MAQIFPKWTNEVPGLATIGVLVGTSAVVFGIWYWFSPEFTDVGYAPVQPVPYSHQLHAGALAPDGGTGLGMDCRYCHATVEVSPNAGVPPTQTCMNCHSQVKKDSPQLDAIRKSWNNGEDSGPVAWKRIHKVPDFAYFDHSAHVGVGVGENRAAVGCETCHGRIDTMHVVVQKKPLSMGWCLECHNDPAKNLRPVEALTRMGWAPDLEWRDRAVKIAATLFPPGSATRAYEMKADGTYITRASAGCSGCHR